MNPGAWSDPSRHMDLMNLNPLMTLNSNFFHSTMNQTTAHGGIFNRYQPYHSFPQSNFTNQQIPASNSAENFFNSGPAAYTPNWTLPASTSIQTIQSPPSFPNLNQRDWPPHWNQAQIAHYASNQAPQNHEQTPAVPPGGPVAPTTAPAATPAAAPVATPAAAPAATPAAAPAANPAVTPGANQNVPPVTPAANRAVQTLAPGPTQAAIATAAANANQQHPLPAVPAAPVVQQYHYIQNQPYIQQQNHHPQQQNQQIILPPIPNPSSKDMPTLSLSDPSSWNAWDMSLKSTLAPCGLLGNILDNQGGFSYIIATYPPPPGAQIGTMDYILWDHWWRVDAAARAVILAKLSPESAAILPHIDDIFRYLVSSRQLYEMLKNAHSLNTWANVVRIKDQLFNTISGSSPEQILQFIQKWRSSVATIRNANNLNCPVIYADFTKRFVELLPTTGPQWQEARISNQIAP
ncbi:hypothetical protein C8J56DRAFT_882197 [Mycena floridula]|nr:hypothetical protein C8J56DRAFT_882197 [Mycena floridula]